MESERIELLASKYIHGSASPAELEELQHWYNSINDEEELLVITREKETLAEKRDKIFREIKSKIESERSTVPVVIPFYRKMAFMKAASVIFLLGFAAIVYFIIQKAPEPNGVADAGTVKPAEVLPKERILLRLADGTEIALDSVGQGLVSTQGGTQILKGDGGLTYKGGDNLPGEALINSIIIPRGQMFQFSLPDGSQVWLNSSSSLQFPVAFNGKERKVTLTGEGYFEIAKNPSKPFKVMVNGKTEVEVLGTHFNINAYANEATLSTTLFEGKLRVTPVKDSKRLSDEARILAPGQQAQMKESGTIDINNNVSEALVLSWKKNLFHFEDATIEEIMAKAAQWYQIDQVIYKGPVEDRFYATISRDMTLDKFLENLERTGKIHFTLSGNIIEVAP